ncbi:protein kinase family protein [Alkalihalobacterium chitinilyticum]|uniref:Protein kinase family protein n=1 Tax=Alkalihalobacterium chitinilyticum TaxID=2980103 RepID=A0ABT5VK33_9BACI|nr:protein kinase family protein [Alkalihalobacterium chitinilyticum]MDE5415805.1 protein kinase family protein [Alkalihalobacterium chitinilyticum]
MKQFDKYGNSVTFKSGNKIEVVNYDIDLRLVGVGKSAAVFNINSTGLALKVFHPLFHHLAVEEAEIYRSLEQIPYYPTLHESGSNYIVIDLIEGSTLYQCLNQGIEVSDQIIYEVDHALMLARDKGLNPSDVHLKNIFITTSGNIMIVDVARFKQVQYCPKWTDTKKAFFKYYQKGIIPKKMPTILLDTIGTLYRKYK